MTASIRLRPLTEADLPQLHRWYQEPRLWDNLVGVMTPRAESDAVAYMRRWLTPTEVELRLAIETVDGGALIGQTILSPIDRAKGEAEFHIMLGGVESRGRGYGRAATEAMLGQAFAMDLTRITLKVLETNVPARRLYERLGFQVTDPAADHVRKGAVRVAVIEMAITPGAYAAGHGAPRSATT